MSWAGRSCSLHVSVARRYTARTSTDPSIPAAVTRRAAPAHPVFQPPCPIDPSIRSPSLLLIVTSPTTTTTHHNKQDLCCIAYTVFAQRFPCALYHNKQDQLLNSTDRTYLPLLHSLLGDQGLRLRNMAISSSTCCPSRTSLLTGL